MGNHHSLKRTCLALAITHSLGLPLANAAVITVNDLSDVSADDANCTLREAIVSANTNPAVATNGCVAGEIGQDTIVFDAGLMGSVSLTQQQTIIPTEDLQLSGPGLSVISIDAASNGLVNTIRPGALVHLQIDNLTLTGANNAFIYARDMSTVTLTDVAVTNNTAAGNGGGINIVDAVVTLTNCTVSSNSATRGGGINTGSGTTLTIQNSSVSENSANFDGGAIRGSSTALISIDGGDISQNTANLRGGGLYLTNTSYTTLNEVTVYKNSAGLIGEFSRYGGGAVIAGAATLISSASQWNNNFSNYGGAIASRYSSGTSLKINQSTFFQNMANAQGGALRMRFTGNVDIIDSGFYENSAGNGGGAISNLTGITMTLQGSTISNNTANGSAGISNNGGVLTVKNSTLSANTAMNYGGGISISSTSSVNIINSTIVSNTVSSASATTIGGGIRIFESDTAAIVNSIVAGNSAENGAEIHVEYGQVLTADANNIFGTASTDSANAFGGFVPGMNDLDLTSDSASQSLPLSSIVEPLTDNGGFTQTHALAKDSPAIDAGDASLCSANQILVDQRGEQRDNTCDIGAFEAPAASSFFVIPTSEQGIVIIEL